jgi:hypothetical protein
MSAASVKEIHTVLLHYLTEACIAADIHKEHRKHRVRVSPGPALRTFVRKPPHGEWDEFGGMILVCKSISTLRSVTCSRALEKYWL